jgi:hypothetical protein
LLLGVMVLQGASYEPSATALVNGLIMKVTNQDMALVELGIQSIIIDGLPVIYVTAPEAAAEEDEAACGGGCIAGIVIAVVVIAVAAAAAVFFYLRYKKRNKLSKMVKVAIRM